jgi:hypothetical protein
MPIDSAKRSGLSPCRVCDPDKVEEPAEADADAEPSDDGEVRAEEPATV